MKLFTVSLLALAAAGIAACSSNNTTEPNPTPKPEPPTKKKQYDAAKGGVQITAIYYNQGENLRLTGLNDEWIVIESDRDISLEGWVLDASDGQRFPFDRSIHRKLVIYTRQGPTGTPSDTTVAMDRGNWIWNNSEPDIATLFDEEGRVVDRMTY